MSEPAAVDERARAPEGGAPQRDPNPEEEASHLAEDQTIAEAFLDAVADAIEAGDGERAATLCDELHPADLADLLGLLSEDDREKLIGLLGGGLPPEVLAELDPDIRESVVLAMRPEKVAEAVADLDTDDAAFVLEDLDEEKRAQILAEVPVTDRLALHAALDYEEETAGRLMQREFFAAPSYWTVGQIIDRLRSSEDLPDRFYEVFVVDPSFKPIGGVPLSTLLKNPRDVRVESLMSDNELRPIPVTMDQEEVAYLFEQYNLISAPVVDESGRLVGMITVDDVVEIVHEETHEDMLALGGVEADTGLSDTVIETVRSRFTWLAVNLGTAILASLVISLFDATIAKVVALAVLMPIVASMGGNAGTQTLTVAVRSLATKDLTAANAMRIIWRETIVGGLNGFLFAIIMGVLAAVWYEAMTGDTTTSVKIGFVAGAAMIINLLAAGVAGILVPLGLQRAGADPAVSSAVFVTTVTDVVGFFSFLGLATIVLL
ncbi:MAG: magnesium transporter [Alphaproteobacteria bacterium]|nr:magnesium transporter [Alphaproteobacteria bacterium]